MTVTEAAAIVPAEELRKDAELVVDVCMSVESGDVVTIITDDDHEDQARIVADVCVARGAWPVIMNNETQVRRGLADTRFPMAPPRNLHQAMVSSDEIIIITNLEWANRFAHVSAVKESCASNAKIASVEPGMGTWGLTEEGLRRAQQRAWDAMAALEGVEKVHVTSPKGTDFTVTIKDRPALEVTSIKRRGQMMGPLPLWAEVAFAAVEDGTDGTMVVDGVMLGIGLPGQVREPITWTLEKGHAVKIEGGEEARRLREVISGVENADIIGEFAFGVSEIAPFGTPSEKGRVGTVHCALGDNHNAYPGGQNVSELHLDGVVLQASMQIVDNGRWILKDGQWVL
ncbi:MAG TPA: aminopeptidase [Solirubrobacteraceae bacterium]|nr:aminopeptidase [Solirubrobacteraceae bacterium]